MQKFILSGHETFHCRHFWLKKGYDFIQNKHKFTDEDAVVALGVGKNMVTSIRFWMRAFGLLDKKDQLTEISHYLFSENGKDPYLENTGTLWLLHYLLVTTGKASIYSLVFNEFRKERTEFNTTHLQRFISRKCQEIDYSISSNTVKKDITIFLKNYVRPKNQRNNFEDDFTAILIDLDLVQELRISKSGGYSWYSIESSDRPEIPDEIILFAILDRYEGTSSISFRNLLTATNSVGTVFSLNANGLIHKIKKITNALPDFVFTDDGGIKELQIKAELEKWKILDNYYAN